MNLTNTSIHNAPAADEFTLSRDALLQSPYLRLQAAGSQGDDSSKGIHCRWLLDGYLGQNHLPKGNYAITDNFYNKKDDFVRLYRIRYESPEKYIRKFSFSAAPDHIYNNLFTWIYNTGEGTFYLRFPDHEMYNKVLSGLDPLKDHIEFLKNYGNALYELEIWNELSFAVNVAMEGGAKVRMETFSVANRSQAEDIPVVSGRQYMTDAAARMVAENIRFIRFSIDAGAIEWIGFETYSYFLEFSMKTGAIEYIDAFALTLDKDLAFKRLEDASLFEVHKRWRKFNDNATVNIANYEDRWATARGIAEEVEKYIDLSEIDPQALISYEDESDSPDGSTMELSLLKFINIASLDYHLARMLGLGYIDPLVNGAYPDNIYLIEYYTKKDPEDFTLEKLTQHLYVSLPTSIKTERLPLELLLEPVQYGLTVNNGTNTPLAITDEQGYSLYTASRFVRLRAALKQDFQQYISFFKPDIEFQSSDFSVPVFVGIENRKEPETEWRRPELSHHETYTDPEGVEETQTIYFNNNNPAPTYIHEVTTEGVDEYAAYPVNIFSRSSVLSDIVSTDKTQFRVANTLKAPVNVAVQLIQEENPLLLTSQTEQEWLQQIDPQKKEIFCRLSFDYHHTHDLNYRYGNKVQVYHKKQMPLNVIGSLLTVDNSDPNVPICTLSTGNYTYISNGQVFKPVITTAEKNKFIGGAITYRNTGYTIIDIIATHADGSYPSIKIKKSETREAVFVNGTYQLKQVFRAPVINGNDAFLIVENLSVAANWAETGNNRLAFTIDLGQSSWPEHSETYFDSEGNLQEELVKGIWDTATIAPSIEGNGVYEIECNTKMLANHPQFVAPDNAAGVCSVNWYRGVVRVHTKQDVAGNMQRKELNVLQIDEINTGNRLKLTVVDNNFSETPAQNIKTGNGISVNFHPGYRVYLRRDDTASFNGAHILPDEDEGSRTSIVGVRTIDTLTLDNFNQPYASPMSVPALLLARELKPPKPPRKPIGPMFATPPDFFNKSSFSFEVEFEHKPWAIVCFRASLETILASLYAPATITQIRSQLPPVKEDVFLEERWGNLLSFDYSGNNGDFDEFENSDGSSYKFPKPNRSPVFDAPYNKPGDVVNKIKDVIYSNLLPLTEQPLIFEYIKGGAYVPQSKKQNITDRNGKLLHPTHPDFDQAPMAKKISNNQVLFTDFTLDGNMHSETAYVYVVREMSRSLQMGAPGPFFGPVQLLNTKAPEKPNVQKLIAESPSAYNTYKPSIQFVVNEMLQSQEISGIQILRGLNGAEALSARSMSVIKEISTSELNFSEGTFTVADDFSNDPEIPFGIPLYYKLVGIRQVKYTDVNGDLKVVKVFSEPTKTLLTNISDTIRPDAPKAEITNMVASGDVITQVDITWNKTCYMGTYVLSFLNASNAWQKIFEIKTNQAAQLSHSWNCELNKFDEAGNPVYYKIKVDVTNMSGLVNRGVAVMAFRAE